VLTDRSSLIQRAIATDVDPARDIGGFVNDAKRAVRGADEAGELALAVLLLLLYIHFKHLTEVAVVMLSIPFSPVTSTVASQAEARRSSSNTCCMPALWYASGSSRPTSARTR
jgi:Cu/Ag efflux pump CusA